MKDRITEIVTPEIEKEGAELVDIVLKGTKRNHILIIYVDKVGGVTISDCTKISRKLLEKTELDDLLGNNYRLEVSSPGIDRPLKTKRDFERHINRILDVQFQDEKGLHKITGYMKKIEENTLTISNEKGELEIPLHSILKATQRVKW
ncbi:MAG: ribosome maturation factor RimP [Calditrichaeota bacterium]|nr:ribosome maturation factor RimP [Calditrichota bacterium]